jgi:hypothetical protein
MGSEGSSDNVCVVNIFSGPGCSGSLTSYTFEADDAPCCRVNGKVSYNVACSARGLARRGKPVMEI